MIQNASQLVRVSIANLPQFHDLGCNFLQGNATIEVLELRNLAKVEKIHMGFVQACPCLKYVSISQLPHLVEISSYFCYGCRSLRELVFDGCLLTPDVTLSESSRPVLGVDHLDSTGQLTRIGTSFCSNCVALPSLLLAGGHFPKLEMMGGGFLEGSGVRSVAIEALPCQRQLKGGFLKCCSKLKVLTFSGSFPLLKTIGDEFCELSCLDRLHFDPISERSQEYPQFPTLQQIGKLFCAGCTGNMENVIIGNMPLLESIGMGFLRRTPVAGSVVLSNLPCLKTIDANFLFHASPTPSLDHIPQPAVVGAHWPPQLFQLQCPQLLFLGFVFQPEGNRSATICSTTRQGWG